MARRIKEEPIVHQNRIADQAQKLFQEKGIGHTSMDEVARMAGYSKATLYVYFKNKDEIVAFLAMKSMEGLKSALLNALDIAKDSKSQFMAMCFALVSYQQEYPEYFERSLNFISFMGETDPDAESFAGRTYQIGEEINRAIARFIKAGVEKKELRAQRNPYVTIFQLWGMIAGLIRLAAEKQEYIAFSEKMTKEEFLMDGFEKIYTMIQI